LKAAEKYIKGILPIQARRRRLIGYRDRERPEGRYVGMINPPTVLLNRSSSATGEIHLMTFTRSPTS
jgi:hypothetical protein